MRVEYGKWWCRNTGTEWSANNYFFKSAGYNYLRSRHMKDSKERLFIMKFYYLSCFLLDTASLCQHK